MTKVICTSLVIVLVWSASEFANAQPRQPSVDLPDELQRVLRDYEVAWKAGDAEGLAALFTADGFVSGRAGWIRGREGIIEKYVNASGDLRLRAHEYAVADSVGYIIGAYGYGDEAHDTDRGKFVLAIRKSDDGIWLIAADLDNSNRN